jgi:hypothetical protein
MGNIKEFFRQYPLAWSVVLTILILSAFLTGVSAKPFTPKLSGGMIILFLLIGMIAQIARFKKNDAFFREMSGLSAIIVSALFIYMWLEDGPEFILFVGLGIASIVAIKYIALPQIISRAPRQGRIDSSENSHHFPSTK